MKILHLAIQAPYNEGWGYQENILPKYQAKLGHEVTLVTSVMKNAENNSTVICEEEDYISPDGFRVIRRDYEHFMPKKLANFVKYYKVFDLLEEIKPDFIMVHGVNNISAVQVKKYLKKVNQNCTVIADNHLDYNIGAGYVQKNLLTRVHLCMVNLINVSMRKIYTKIYGVTPWRSEYAAEIFGMPKEKLDVLPAGADDEKIDYENKKNISNEIRKANKISENDFLIITGGKIDEKKNIDRLMEAVAKIDNNNIKLLVFGQCADSIKAKIEALAKHPNIRYIGWISSDDTYNYFLAADLMFFPGQHSVMWEQACACGTPCVFKDYHGMHHVDVGGNCMFLKDDSVEEIKKIIECLLENPETYTEMLRVASSEKRKTFLYSELARKSLETAKEC